MTTARGSSRQLRGVHVTQTITLRGRTDRDRHPRRLARAAEAAQARLPARRARRPGRLGDPVRARAPPDARQHVLGRGPVRDVRAPLGARRRARLRGRGGQRLHVRPRHHPRRPRPPPCGCRCCARRSSPTPTPTRANTGSASRCGSVRRSATPSREGYRLNLPLRRVRGGNDIAPLVVVDDPAVVVEAVKLAEDGSGDVVVRLYEALGSRASSADHRDVRPRVGGRDRPAGGAAARPRSRSTATGSSCARSRSSPCASTRR